MKMKIYPSKTKAIISAPSSKSYGHRALICAGLADGVSEISHLGYSKDIKATISTLEKLGAKIQLDGDKATVTGINSFENSQKDVFCNESGSTLRFMIPVFALDGKEHVFTGKGRLISRPQSVYQKLFDDNDLLFEHNEDSIRISGPLKAGDYKLDGSISSQFFTGLLFALPLCDGDSTIEIINNFESKSYVVMTIEVLSLFGIKIDWLNETTLKIYGNQKYVSRNYKVEGDYSATAFIGLLGAINYESIVKDLNVNSLQGDKVFFDILKASGALVEIATDGYKISPKDKKNITVDLADCPDLGPAVMAIGAYNQVGMKLINIARLRYKESDRVLAMKSELENYGYTMYDKENEAEILASKQEILSKEYHIEGHNDHRIVMSMAILATMMDKPTIITDSEAVSKSYPEFWNDLRSAGVVLEEVYD